MEVTLILTDGIFETGAYGVPSKSQKLTVLGQGGPSSTQCSNPSWARHWCQPTTTLHFDIVLKTKYSFRHWIFLFFAKIRLEIANI